MKMNASIVQPSRKQLSQMRDYTDDNAPSRETLGEGFWATAQAQYPSRDQRLVRLRLDLEILNYFDNQPEGRDAINSILRAYVEEARARKG